MATREQLYNRLQDIIKSIELNEFITYWKLPNLVYKDAKAIRELFDNDKEFDLEGMEHRIKWCEDTITRFLWTYLRTTALTKKGYSKRIEKYCNMKDEDLPSRDIH